MHPLTEFIVTPMGLGAILLLVCVSIVFTLLSVNSLRPIHAKINCVLALLFGFVTYAALSLVRAGDGMGGLMFALVGLGAGALTVIFLAATVSTSIVLAMRGGTQASATRSPRRRGPSAAPLLEQYNLWKVRSRRPSATYEDFLREAHPREFPASPTVLAFAAIAMAIVTFLVLR